MISTNSMCGSWPALREDATLRGVAFRDARVGIACGDRGTILRTVDGGRTWTEQDYPTAQIYRVSTTSDFPYHLCGTQQDAKAVALPSRSATGLPGFAEVYRPYYLVSGSESGYIAPHPAKPNLFFTGATNQLTRFDRSNGP